VTKDSLLKNKRIIIVDDELDVLQTLQDLLSGFDVTTASEFGHASYLLRKEDFDIAIFDIMGVDGYKLLDIAAERKILALVLTAHALTPADTVRSFRKGAVSFLPKEHMPDIVGFLEEVLEDAQKSKNPLLRWLERWGSYFDEKFGPDWKKEDGKFWDRFTFG
jgi:DNA-binding response OmpR family regulator